MDCTDSNHDPSYSAIAYPAVYCHLQVAACTGKVVHLHGTAGTVWSAAMCPSAVVIALFADFVLVVFVVADVAVAVPPAEMYSYPSG